MLKRTYVVRRALSSEAFTIVTDLYKAQRAASTRLARMVKALGNVTRIKYNREIPEDSIFIFLEPPQSPTLLGYCMLDDLFDPVRSADEYHDYVDGPRYRLKKGLITSTRIAQELVHTQVYIHDYIKRLFKEDNGASDTALLESRMSLRGDTHTKLVVSTNREYELVDGLVEEGTRSGFRAGVLSYPSGPHSWDPEATADRYTGGNYVRDLPSYMEPPAIAPGPLGVITGNLGGLASSVIGGMAGMGGLQAQARAQGTSTYTQAQQQRMFETIHPTQTPRSPSADLSEIQSQGRLEDALESNTMGEGRVSSLFLSMIGE